MESRHQCLVDLRPGSTYDALLKGQGASEVTELIFGSPAGFPPTVLVQHDTYDLKKITLTWCHFHCEVCSRDGDGYVLEVV